MGFSRRNKHIQLRSEKGQLQLSKVHPDKNLAHSLTNAASDKRMLAKLRVVTEAAETLALSTVRGQCLASFGSSSSFLVGMIAAEHPKMAQLQLRQLALPKIVSDSFERTCFENLPRNFAESLTLPSLSLSRASLTLHSLSFPRGNLESLTLHSLSLIDENRLQRIIFKEGIFGDGSLEETAKNIEHRLAKGELGRTASPNIAFKKSFLPKRLERTASLHNELSR